MVCLRTKPSGTMTEAIYQLLDMDSGKEEIKEVMADHFDTFDVDFEMAWESANRLYALPEEG